MKPEEMENAMIKNMVEKTGNNLNHWIKLVHTKNFNNNVEIVTFLKSEHSIGHFYAHLIAKRSVI